MQMHLLGLRVLVRVFNEISSINACGLEANMCASLCDEIATWGCGYVSISSVWFNSSSSDCVQTRIHNSCSGLRVELQSRAISHVLHYSLPHPHDNNSLLCAKFGSGQNLRPFLEPVVCPWLSVFVSCPADSIVHKPFKQTAATASVKLLVNL